LDMSDEERKFLADAWVQTGEFSRSSTSPLATRREIRLWVEMLIDGRFTRYGDAMAELEE